MTVYNEQQTLAHNCYHKAAMETSKSNNQFLHMQNTGIKMPNCRKQKMTARNRQKKTKNAINPHTIYMYQFNNYNN